MAGRPAECGIDGSASGSSTASGPHPSQPSKPTHLHLQQKRKTPTILLNPLGSFPILPRLILLCISKLPNETTLYYFVNLTIVCPAFSIDQPHISFILSATYCSSSHLILLKYSFVTFRFYFLEISEYSQTIPFDPFSIFLEQNP